MMMEGMGDVIIHTYHHMKKRRLKERERERRVLTYNDIEMLVL